MSSKEDEGSSRKELDRELDHLEAEIDKLKIQFEQYFVDILPQPPDKLQENVVRLIRKLLRAPFKNSATRFRLRTLVQRYQTYHTYWERVLKQREDGTYFRDVFKADMRDKMEEDYKQLAQKNKGSDRGIEQLYQSYEKALQKAGGDTNNLNYDGFKQSLIKKAKELKQKHGVKKLSYKIVVKDGKVIVKASSK